MNCKISKEYLIEEFQKELVEFPKIAKNSFCEKPKWIETFEFTVGPYQISMTFDKMHGIINFDFKTRLKNRIITLATKITSIDFVDFAEEEKIDFIKNLIKAGTNEFIGGLCNQVSESFILAFEKLNINKNLEV